MPKSDKLTLKQQRFAEQWVKHGNGAKAARDAGYSERSAREQAVENLAKPNIADYIAELAAEAGAAEKLTPDMILAGLLRLAQGAENEGTQARALELLARAKGMFRDVVEITDTRETAGLLAQLRATNPQLAAVFEAELGLSGEETTH